MPKIALLSDIHANLTALEAVLKEVQSSGADSIVFLGDIVGYGANPAECVRWVRRLSGQIVMGNHDAELKNCRQPGFEPDASDGRQSDYWSALMHAVKFLSEDDIDWLLAQPYWFGIPGAIVAHSSLHELDQFHYVDDQRSALASLEVLAQFPDPVGFVGHTHLQQVFSRNSDAIEWLDQNKFSIEAGEPCVVSVGSVGQSREQDNRNACWVLWDPELRIVEWRQTDYDRLHAARSIVKAGLPLASAIRLLEPDELRIFLLECANESIS